ncbi:MAG: hypothetical protein M3R58_15965 [Pseudomonadota bacterium]|nr:hypothetical protein [Pseudomonadota bacterium]
MRSLTKVLAAATMAAMLAAPAVQAREDMDADKFVKMCDADKDGMVSKAEMMKMMEKMFDKQDTKKMGKIDKKQVDAFLKDFMKMSGM